ncbi:FAD-dependent oxidoreductase [Patescibacteria group bacterium]|nr:FAD-dependent oxidoreductase [Patescibacteria group bacterium]MBU4579785.1 FAD-dependent oxidoreductase [Patescibacteria group bacterium]
MIYDLIILGAGPAGLAASIYASYHKLSHLVIGDIIGGTATEAVKIKNWPGTEMISGVELMQKFQYHAEGLGGKIVQAKIAGLKKGEEYFEINTNSENYQAKAILVALGTRRRKMNIPGEDKFLGKGVSYCATCDSMFFKNKTVSVVGGGNSAAMAASLLAEHASKVFLIYRGAELRCEPATVDQLKANSKISIIYNTNVLEVNGDKKVESIILDNDYQDSKILKVDGIFVEIGAMPSSDLLNELGVKLNEQGYVAVDQWGKTNVSGVYAAGDIISNTPGFNQIITASADGATAINAVYKYLKEVRK